MPFQAEAENNSCSNRNKIVKIKKNTYKNEMKVKDKKSVQSLLKVDDLKQNKIYLNKKKQMDIYKYI